MVTFSMTSRLTHISTLIKPSNSKSCMVPFPVTLNMDFKVTSSDARPLDVLYAQLMRNLFAIAKPYRDSVANPSFSAQCYA